MAGEKEKMSTGRKILITLIFLFLLLTAAAYFVGVNYFSRHFLPGSWVNGFNCSYMTAEEAEALLAEKAESYVLAIQTRGNGQESITAQQIGLSYTSDGSVQRFIEKQSRFQWFLSFGQQSSYELTSAASYDVSALYNAVMDLKCIQNSQDATDAYIVDNGTTFEIVPESEGAQLDVDKVQEVISRAVIVSQPQINLEDEECYVMPSVYSDDENLIRQCEQANEFGEVIITYDFADRKETVDRSVIRDWLVIQNGECTLDREKVAAYVYELAQKYDTIGNIREFRTYNGRTITISDGDYGWAIDQTAETDALIDAVKNGETQVREPVYSAEGWSRDTNDIGYTYIEIDLTNQRMVLYQNGKPTVDTAIVTGNPNIPGMETPVGCYALDEMQSPAALTEEGCGYNVSFWMKFCGNVGIHDASWRTQFGNNLYQWEGTQGCVNAPYDKVQAIYQSVDVGCPIVIYK